MFKDYENLIRFTSNNRYALCGGRQIGEVGPLFLPSERDSMCYTAPQLQMYEEHETDHVQ